MPLRRIAASAAPARSIAARYRWSRESGTLKALALVDAGCRAGSAASRMLLATYIFSTCGIMRRGNRACASARNVR